MNLSPDDAMELGQLLHFLDDWLATDREQFGISLARFIGIDGYGLETLRDDLARFMFLLGETDGERLFSPRAAELDRTTAAGHVRSARPALDERVPWHRWTAISLLAYAFLAVAAALQRARDGSTDALGLIPVTIPELLRHLRGTVIPEPRRDKAYRDAWTLWRRRHQYQSQQAHQRWNAYADEVPQP